MANVRDCLKSLKETFICSICLETLRDPCVTPCCHLFCSLCFAGLKENLFHVKCPLCQQEFRKKEARQVPVLQEMCSAARELIIMAESKSGPHNHLEGTESSAHVSTCNEEPLVNVKEEVEEDADPPLLFHALNHNAEDVSNNNAPAESPANGCCPLLDGPHEPMPASRGGFSSGCTGGFGMSQWKARDSLPASWRALCSPPAHALEEESSSLSSLDSADDTVLPMMPYLEAPDPNNPFYAFFKSLPKLFSKRQMRLNREEEDATIQRILAFSSKQEEKAADKEVASVSSATAVVAAASSGSSKRYQVTSSNLTPREKKIVRQMCATLENVCYLEKFEPGLCTHLVVNSFPYEENSPHLVCKRKAKYLHAIVNGAWIVSLDWSRESLRAGKLLNESDFEITGDQTMPFVQFIPRQARQLHQQGSRKLLDGFVIAPLGEFGRRLKMHHFESLVQAAGGLFVKSWKRIPTLLTNDDDDTKNVVLVVDRDWNQGSFNDCQRVAGALQPLFVQIVTLEWIVDCITLCTILPFNEMYALWPTA